MTFRVVNEAESVVRERPTKTSAIKTARKLAKEWNERFFIFDHEGKWVQTAKRPMRRVEYANDYWGEDDPWEPV